MNADTQTVNICCIAKDSRSIGEESSHDFDAQQTGVSMWLERCNTEESTSVANLNVVTGAEVYANKSIISSITGNGKKVLTYN